MGKKLFKNDFSGVKAIRSFIRDESGRPVGYIVAVLDEETNTYNVDFSATNPRDKFDKNIAVHVAFERAINHKDRSARIRESILPHFEHMVLRAFRYFKNAVPCERVKNALAFRYMNQFIE